MNEVVGGTGLSTGVAARRDVDLTSGGPGAGRPEAVGLTLAEVRRELQQQIDWQAQQLAPRRGPSASEVSLVLGSLATGAAVTCVLVANATTVISGLFGSQSASHQDILPFVAVIWLALLAINMVWARRR